jgi:hypothetical protein
MRIGEFGGVLGIHNVRHGGGKEGGCLNSIRVAYRFGGGMDGLGKGRL